MSLRIKLLLLHCLFSKFIVIFNFSLRIKIFLINTVAYSWKILCHVPFFVLNRQLNGVQKSEGWWYESSKTRNRNRKNWHAIFRASKSVLLHEDMFTPITNVTEYYFKFCCSITITKNAIPPFSTVGIVSEYSIGERK